MSAYLANVPLLGRLFAEDDSSLSFATMEDAQSLVERLASEFQEQQVAMQEAKEAMEKAEEARRQQTRADIAMLEQHKQALEQAVANIEATIRAKEASLGVNRVGMADIPYAVLKRGDDVTTNALIEALSDDAVFKAKARDATESLLRRDAEDDRKLAAGIALAVERGVLEADAPVEPVTEIDVYGKSADAVADAIYSACVNHTNGAAPDAAPDDPVGRVVVIQGLSGCGKGTTVAKLLQRFNAAVAWSNGNVFRTLTLLALEHCVNAGIELDESVLTPENLRRWINCLTFDLFPEGYDVMIDGEGVRHRVSHIVNTKLKEPRIGKVIPTVANFAQGEVVKFAEACVQKMARDGLTCLCEGRAPTLAYIRTPLRFELTINDPQLLGARRVAQRVLHLALDHLKAAGFDSADDDARGGPPQDAVVDALKAAIAAL